MTPEKIKKILETMSLEELSWVLGRYCGPHNTLLAIRKFSEPIDRSWVEEEIIERHLLDTDNTPS